MTPPLDTPIQAAARMYLARGWAAIPVPAGAKIATRTAWQLERWTADDLAVQFADPGGNVGLLPGAPSGGLVDLDCDCREALALADAILPATAARFGRVSTPGSHRLYRVAESLATRRYRDPLAVDDTRACLVEVRGTGTQTLAPPSVYPEGERCVWHADGDPAMVGAADLVRAAERLAAVALLARHWPGEGGRHDAAMAVAGGLLRSGWDAADIAALMEQVATAAGDDEIADRVRAVPSTAAAIAAGQSVTGWTTLGRLLDPRVMERAREWLCPRGADPASPTDAAPAGKDPAQATVLVSLVHDAEAELFHTADGDPFATLPLDGHWETWPLRGKGFRQYLARAYYLAKGRAPGSQAVKDAIEVLAGEAQFAGPERAVAIRIEAVAGAVYLDLGTRDWRVIRVDAAGWAAIGHAEAPVRFRRPRGLLPLPEPVRGGSIRLLRPFVNCAGEEEWLLVVGWLVGCFYPVGPRVVLQLLGEQGSAKSTLARLLRSLVDPNQVPLRTQPKDEGDLLIAAINGAVVAIDNLSELPRWLSDALCRLATGGGLSKRELFTDADEILLDARRPAVLTAITEVATASDLLDRCLTVLLTAIGAGERRTELAIGTAFAAAQPGILGALLDAVSTGLGRLPTVRLEHAPRMADFATWVEAAAPAFGWEPGDFLEAMAANRRNADAVAIEALPVGPALLRFMADRDAWQGSPTALLAELTALVADEVKREREWPKRANRLSGHLRRLAPNLRQVGLRVGADRTGGTGERLVILTKNQPVWDRHRRHDRHLSEETPAEPSPDRSSHDRHPIVTDRHTSVHILPDAPGDAGIRDARDDGDDGFASLDNAPWDDIEEVTL